MSLVFFGQNDIDSLDIDRVARMPRISRFSILWEKVIQNQYLAVNKH